MACDVNQTIDEGSYQCAIVATGNKRPLIQDVSNKLNLKITGIDLIFNLFVIQFANASVRCLV